MLTSRELEDFYYLVALWQHGTSAPACEQLGISERKGVEVRRRAGIPRHLRVTPQQKEAGKLFADGMQALFDLIPMLTSDIPVPLGPQQQALMDAIRDLQGD